jgi:hypothetical protein
MSAEKKVERRTDEEALPGHVIDVGLHIAAGVGALQVGVAAVEFRAHSGHGLGLERVQDQVSLGREVVVQAAEAEVGGPAAWRMVRSLAPWRSMSGATARKISCWGRRRSSGGWPDFPDMAPSFRGGGLEYRATPLADLWVDAVFGSGLRLPGCYSAQCHTSTALFPALRSTLMTAGS